MPIVTEAVDHDAAVSATDPWMIVILVACVLVGAATVTLVGIGVAALLGRTAAPRQ